MITDFVALLQLFAGLGVSIYFLIEHQVENKLFGVIQVESKILAHAQEEEAICNNRQLRDKTATVVLLAAMNNYLKRHIKLKNTIKRSISLLRYDGLSITLYCLLLMLLATFETVIENDSFIMDASINFSILVLIVSLERSFRAPLKEEIQNEGYQGVHLSLWEEIVKVLAAFLLSITISILVSAKFPEWIFRVSLGFIILLPFLSFGIRYCLFKNKF